MENEFTNDFQIVYGTPVPDVTITGTVLVDATLRARLGMTAGNNYYSLPLPSTDFTPLVPPRWRRNPQFGRLNNFHLVNFLDERHYIFG